MEVIEWANVNFQAGEVKIEVKAQNDSTKEIQILMSKDSIMKEHKAPFDIFVQVLCGSIAFEVKGHRYNLKTLDMISLEANIPHSLTAFENSIIRLSLAKNDSISRVNAVLKS